MLNKKTVAMAMAVATVAPAVAPIVANAAENVIKVQVSSGETERIAKIEAELEKAKKIYYTNSKVVENSQGNYTVEYTKYEKNLNDGSNKDVSIYRIERTTEGNNTVIRVVDRGHRVGYETTWNPTTNKNETTKVVYDFDENGKNIEEKLVAEITITNKSTVNKYNVDAKDLFKTNGKYNESGKLFVNFINNNKLTNTQTVANGSTIGKQYTVEAEVKDEKGNVKTTTHIITVWGTPVVNTEDSKIGALAGLDRCETAVQVSQEGWKKGADTVIIAGWDGLADGLAVTPLASAMDAPILISTKTGLDANTRTEIDRLQAKNVIIVGGEKTVSPNVEQQLKSMGFNVERIAGEDRMRTSFAIAKKLENVLAAEGKDIQKVFVAGGYDGEADALSIASNAGKIEQPILLVEKNHVADDVKSWIASNSADVNIIGGSYSIGSKVENDLKEIDKDLQKIGGANVQETNAQVINNYHSRSKGLLIAQDNNLVDALAAGPLAAQKDVPVVLGTNNISTSQQQAIKNCVEDKEYKNTYQVGHGVTRTVVKYIEKLLINIDNSFDK